MTETTMKAVQFDATATSTSLRYATFRARFRRTTRYSSR